MSYYIPRILDVDQLLIESPHSIPNFNRKHLLHIIDLITSIPANNKRLTFPDGYVPINAKLLQKSVRNYKAYLRYLLSASVLETDNMYITGSKSKGYRFTRKYSGIVRSYGTIPKINHSDIIKNLTAQQASTHAHLIKWYGKGLQINKDLALPYIESDYNSKMQNPKFRDWDAVAHTYKNPVNQYNNALVAVEKIARGHYFLNIDDTGHRLHTPLTNMKSELRNFLTYTGLQLVSIDICNSQPYLSTLLFNPSFWDSTQVLTLNTIELDYTHIFSSSSFFSSFLMLCKNATMCTNSDIYTYIETVRNGVFYEYMEEKLEKETRGRKNLKAIVFQTLFTDNRFIGQEDAEPKRVFRQSFPTVYKILSALKRKNKTNLPMLLQRIESYLILQVITKCIAGEHPELPLFTIHDSIVTVQGMEGYVQQVMEEKMKLVFGFPPKLSISYWKPEDLNIAAINSLALAG